MPRPSGRKRYLHRRRKTRRWPRRIVAGAILLELTISADAILILGRMDRLRLDLPPDGPGTTYLLIGSDSRGFVDEAADQRSFGDADTVPGSRADLVFVVHLPEHGEASLLAVPRDLVVFSADGAPTRLGLTALDGTQAIVDALCGSLGIAPDHVVVVDFDAFRHLIDALGGVVVDVAGPIRDEITGLNMETGGRQDLDGATALAYLRSRQGEILLDGTWIREPEGALGRVARARAVLEGMAAAVPDLAGDPLRAQRFAWNVAGSLRVDAGFGIRDLVALGTALRHVTAEAATDIMLPTAPMAERVPHAIGRWPPIPPRPSRFLTSDALAALEGVGVATDPRASAACPARLIGQNWMVDGAGAVSPEPAR